MLWIVEAFNVIRRVGLGFIPRLTDLSCWPTIYTTDLSTSFQPNPDLFWGTPLIHAVREFLGG